MPFAPGSILQRMHLRDRLRLARIADGYFIEIGAGEGDMSRLLLEEGFSGCGFDLSPEACRRNRRLNKEYISSNRYQVMEKDFLSASVNRKADVIICSMVIEHLPTAQVDRLLAQVTHSLSTHGIFCILVPSSPAHWGIEDDVAGHLRRYTFDDFPALVHSAGLVIRDLRGLTYPLSNILLPLSNYLVQRAEGYKLQLTLDKRTIASGARDVPFKTKFPPWLTGCLNEFSLYPFHVWQKLAARNSNSLVIYCETSLPDSGSPKSPSIS